MRSTPTHSSDATSASFPLLQYPPLQFLASKALRLNGMLKRKTDKQRRVVQRPKVQQFGGTQRRSFSDPGVLGGIVGAVNVGILGTVGWYAYINWDAPRWDRKVVSAVGCGLLTLWGAEGCVIVLSATLFEKSDSILIF